MRICPACGRENPDGRDFCACGEYLRWEMSGAMPAVPAAAPEAPAPQGDGRAPAAGSGPPAPAQPAAVRPEPTPPRPPPVAATPPPADEVTAAGERAVATIALRVPGVDGTPGAPVAVLCDAGGRVDVLALVRNAGGIVDRYRLTVAGMPDEWYTVTPDPVHLFPFGSNGPYEEEARVQIHPPRSPEAEARVWKVEVVAESAAHGRPVASAPLVVGIQPYEEFVARLEPTTASGRRRAHYAVVLRNKANAPVQVGLGITDPENALRADFERPDVEVPAGAAETTRLAVRAPRPRWLGRPVEHRFEVLARTGEEAEAMRAQEAASDDDAGGPGLAGAAGALGLKGPKVSVGPGGVKVQEPQARLKQPKVPVKSFGLENLKRPGGAAPAGISAPPPLPTQAVFRQKPMIPRWALLLVLLPLLVAVGLYLALPRDVAVPDVGGVEVAKAIATLSNEELVPNAEVRQEVSRERAGTVIAQDPPAGTKVDKGFVVLLTQAVGSADRKVPDVIGQPYADAVQAIEDEDLTLGAVAPDPPDPAAKVKLTIPPANEVTKVGKAVQIFLREPKAPDDAAGEDGGDDGNGDGSGGGGQPSGKPFVLAAVGGQAPAAASAALQAAGVAPQIRRVYSDQAPAGEVIATDPPAGDEVQPGDTVQVLVSRGIPEVAYDTNEDVILVNGFDGKAGDPIAQGPARELQPSFNSTGTAVAYVAADQIHVRDLAKPSAAPRALTRGTDVWRRPTFAPTPETDVLAAIKSTPGVTEGDLCLGPVTRRSFDPPCLHRDGIHFLRVVRWSPDGKALFAFAARDDLTGFGMYRVKARRPFASDLDDYGRGAFVTDLTQAGKGVIDLAISPDGTKMAGVANFRGGEFFVYLTVPGDFTLAKAKKTQIDACEVAWRPDSEELLAVESDDCNTIDTGDVKRVSPDNPTRPTALPIPGDSPTYRPPPPEADGDSG